MNLTDEEIRVKCAEAMGWKWVQEADGGSGLWQSPKSVVPSYLYPGDYLTSVDAALTLCDKLREEGWNIDIYSSSIDWGAEVSTRGGALLTVRDPSLARAICLAFLATQQPTEQETR